MKTQGASVYKGAELRTTVENGGIVDADNNPAHTSYRTQALHNACKHGYSCYLDKGPMTTARLQGNGIGRATASRKH